MDHLSAHEIMTKVITYVTLLWGILFIPALIMAVLVATGHGTVASHSGLTWKILYYNLIVFPFLILFSSIYSWQLLKKKKYRNAFLIVLLPLLTILIETIVLDIVLWFS